MSGKVFFSWWRARLGELVPALLKRRWGSARAGIILAVDGEQVQVRSANGAHSTLIDLEEGHPAQQSPEIAALLDTLSGGPRQIGLQLQPHDYLVRYFSLPRAAQGNLAEAVGYQLPQLTPFSADQLLYACGETDDSPATGNLSMWLVAVPRQRVQRALTAIGQPLPDNPLRLGTPPAAGEPLSLSWRATDQSPNPWRSMRFAWAALLVLWIGVLGIYLFKQEQQQRMLDETLDDLRGKAAMVSALQDRLSGVRLRISQLSELKDADTSALVVLEQLSQLLDDDTWLVGLELGRGQLTLRGVSASPASLIETLEGTDIFRDVSFDSAITRDGRSEGDRFNIRATLERPAGRPEQ